MVDFSVDGLATVKENLSRNFAEIASAVDEAKEQMRDTTGVAGALSGAMGTLGGSSEFAEEEFESLGDEFSEIIVKGQGVVATLQEIGAAEVATAAQAESLAGMNLPGELMDTKSFRRNLLQEAEFSGSGPARGRLLGLLASTDFDTVGDLAQKMREWDDLDTSSTVAGLQAINAAAAQTYAEIQGLEHAQEDLNDEIAETGNDSLVAAAKMQAFNIASHTMSGNLSDAILNFKQLRKKIQGADDDLSALGPQMSSLSANIGPFNVGLKNLAVTLPLLLGAIGLLVTILGGFITAIVGATAAVGAFMGVGILGFAEDLEEQFAGVEDKSQALMAIMKGLAGALKEAIAPLQSVEVGGMGAVEFFIEGMQQFVLWVRSAANVLSDLLEGPAGDALLRQLYQLRDAFIGVGMEGTGMGEALETVITEILPIITDFVVWFIDALPEFMEFSAMITTEIVPALSEFLFATMELTAFLTGAMSDALQHILPILGLFFLTLVKIGKFIGGILGMFEPVMTEMLGIAFAAAIVIKSIGAIVSGFLLIMHTVLGLSAVASTILSFVAPLIAVIAVLQVLHNWFGNLGVIIPAVVSAITLALIGSGWGAILVAIGALVVLIANNFDTLKGAVTDFIDTIMSPLEFLFWLLGEIQKVAKDLLGIDGGGPDPSGFGRGGGRGRGAPSGGGFNTSGMLPSAPQPKNNRGDVVNVTVNNEGKEMDDRDAHRVGEVMNQQRKTRRRRQG